eukprot:scaffold174820_cov28-Tisochrysis_lutea.AAC.2
MQLLAWSGLSGPKGVCDPRVLFYPLHDDGKSLRGATEEEFEEIVEAEARIELSSPSSSSPHCCKRSRASR